MLKKPKPIPIYEWTGPEETCGVTVVTTANMTIEELIDSGANLTAEGTFTFRDHAEGCDGKDPWTAKGSFDSGIFVWTVQRKEPSEGELVFRDKEEKPMFCAIEGVNQAIKIFVAKKLTKIAVQLRTNPTTETIIEGPKKYDGPMYKYKGYCVCEEVDKSGNIGWLPFDWNKRTAGGQYPANCFECSCGQKWYRGRPDLELWTRVDDLDTWNMLTTNNGVVVELLSIHPEQNPPRIILTKKLRDEGFIPMG